MKRVTFFAIALVSVLTFFPSFSNAQTDTVEAEIESQKVEKEMDKTSPSKGRGLKISVSYSDSGTLERLFLESTGEIIEPERMYAILEELIPLSDRGAKSHETKLSFKRLVIHAIQYEKVRFSLSERCKEDLCGYSFAEINFRQPNPPASVTLPRNLFSQPQK